MTKEDTGAGDLEAEEEAAAHQAREPASSVDKKVRHWPSPENIENGVAS